MGHRSFKKRAFSTTTILILTGGSMMLGLGITSLAMTQDSHSGRSATKAQANDLAESAVHLMYQKIKTQMVQSKTYPSSITSTALTYSTRNGNDRQIGTFEATVVSATITSQTVAASDNNVATRKTYVFLIEGIGTASNGVQSRIRSKFTGTVDESDGTYKQTVWGQQADGNGIPFSVCPGAIMSNAAIRFTTNQGIRTTAANNDAHVVANRGIEWNPTTGTKADVSNPNVIDIQGQFQVPGSAQYASIYDFTVGPSGLGNSSGIKNYRSPEYDANGGNPALAANTVARREYPRPYPSQQMFDEWEAEWAESASAGTNYAGSLTAGTMPPDTNGNKNLRAPVIIEGDLTVPSGDSLRLVPTSEKPWENIVYVRGNVQNLGQLKNLGVTIVMLGKYSDGPSAEYEIETDGSMYPNRNSVMQHANFMSLNADADAVRFTTNSSSDTGLIYAARGGIQVTGSPEFTGKLVAAGSQDIQISPSGGNSFVMNYDPNSGGNRRTLGSAEERWQITLAAGTVVRAFDCDRLRDWLTIK